MHWGVHTIQSFVKEGHLMFFVVEKVQNIYETQYVYVTNIFLLSCLLNLHEKCIWVRTLTSDYFTL